MSYFDNETKKAPPRKTARRILTVVLAVLTAVVMLFSFQLPAKVSASETYPVTISNVDENGDQMADCGFTIYTASYDDDGNVVKGTEVTTFTSTETATVVNLEAGTYVLSQTSVPEPYLLTDDAVFTVESDGHVLNTTGKKYYVKNLDLSYIYPPRSTENVYIKNGREVQYIDVDGNIVPWESDYRASMMQLINPDAGGVEYVYCFNKEKAPPLNDPSETPVYYSQNSTPQLFYDYADSLQGTPDSAYQHVLGILENGFPNSTTLQSQYNLTDQQFYAVTQWAIWYYTDGVTYSNDLTFSVTNKPDGDEYTDDWTSDMFSAYNALLADTYSGEQTAEFFTAQSQTNTDDESYQNVIGARFVTTSQKVTVSNVKPISVYKVDDSGESVSDAVLQMSDSYGNVIDTWTTDGSAHEIDLSTLNVNEQYLIKETTTPDGYKKASSKTIKTDGSYLYLLTYVSGEGYKWIKQDEPVVNLVDTKLHTVSVKKVDGDSGDAVSGAELELLRVTSSGQTSVDTWTTDGTDHEISGLVPGYYTLVENTAPTGYDTADSITFYLYSDGKISIQDADGNYSDKQDAVITMTDYKPAVTFNKVDADTGEALSGAELTLVQGEDADGTSVASWTTDGSAHRVTDLEAGTYTLVETEAPDGYETAASITFRLDESWNIYLIGSDGTESEAQEAVITMEDEAKTYTVQFNKVDTSSGEALSGAKLELVQGESADGTSVETWTTDGKTHEISGLEAGTYTLVERTAPNGYETAASITFRIDTSGYIHIVRSDGTESDAQEAVITMKDAETTVPEKNTVRFNKVDADSGEALSGAKLELVQGNDAAGTAVASWTTSGEAHELNSLNPGTYTLVEKSAPDGYETAASITFRLDDSGYIHIIGSDGTESAAQEAVITMEDEKTTVVPDTHAVSFNKVDADSGEALSGAKLKLVQGENASGTAVESWTTDGKTYEMSGLEAGTYTLVETEAPDGYETAASITFRLDDSGYIHLIGSDGTESTAQEAVITMKDEQTTVVPDTHAVSFNKVDADSGEALSGAKLKLVQGENADGTSVESWTTDGETYEISGLEAGTYTLVETEAPDGYETAASITFRLDDSGYIHLIGSDGTESDAQEAVITMEDEKTGGTTVTTDNNSSNSSSDNSSSDSSSSNSSTSSTPATGDDSSAVPWITIAVAIVAAALLIRQRRRLQR